MDEGPVQRVPFPMQPLITRILLLTGFTLCSYGALAEHYTVPLFVTASTTGEPQGVLRILNGTSESGTVEIHAIDDSGTRSGPATFTLNASAAAQFTATDLQSGNASKGLSGAWGRTWAMRAWRSRRTCALCPWPLFARLTER